LRPVLFTISFIEFLTQD